MEVPHKLLSVFKTSVTISSFIPSLIAITAKGDLHTQYVQIFPLELGAMIFAALILIKQVTLFLSISHKFPK